jgi:8-oxo-dGTP diphosphatase
MMKKINPSYYQFIIKVQAIAKIGLQYSKDPYALDNYRELNTVSMAMLKAFNQVDFSRPNYFTKDIYPTPNVAVRIVIFNQQNEVLLVQEKVDKGFTLPGGWADIDESPVEAAKKECLQEAGAVVTITGLTGIYFFPSQQSSMSQYTLVFKAELVEPLQPFDHEIIAVQFFQAHALPESISKKIAREDLARMIADATQGVTHFE